MKKIILVVDDEIEIAQSVETILVDEGYDVLSVGDGLQAQKLLTHKRPDLIISDVMMPHCNGYQLLRKLREQDNLKDIPVILMSAAQMNDNEVAPESFLKKPFDLEGLLFSVEKVLGKNK